jgi:hypothetical protein
MEYEAGKSIIQKCIAPVGVVDSGLVDSGQLKVERQTGALHLGINQIDWNGI